MKWKLSVRYGCGRSASSADLPNSDLDALV